MALSTTDLGTGGTGSGMAKTIAPGNHILKINSIELADFSFLPGAKHLILNVETTPIEGFDGFLIDKGGEALVVEVKPRRSCALSLLDDQLNFSPLPCEALH